jgi:hypothetical protein
MAARLRAKHQDEIRTKIQTSQLINVLQNHALGQDTTEMTATRMKAIELLLKKCLPDLSSTEITGDPESPLTVQIITGINDEA